MSPESIHDKKKFPPNTLVENFPNSFVTCREHFHKRKLSRIVRPLQARNVIPRIRSQLHEYYYRFEQVSMKSSTISFPRLHETKESAWIRAWGEHSANNLWWLPISLRRESGQVHAHTHESQWLCRPCAYDKQGESLLFQFKHNCLMGDHSPDEGGSKYIWNVVSFYRKQ